jgi:hypothetical protein
MIDFCAFQKYMKFKFNLYRNAIDEIVKRISY